MPGAEDKGLGRKNTAAPRERQGHNHLFVIAIDDYTLCPRLNNCVKDARDLIDLLTGHYQFDPSRVYTLVNEAATRENILTHLRDLRQKVGPNDNLVLYFSGHGDTEDEVGYWIPMEADPERPHQFVSTYDIKTRLNAIDSFHTFVIVDACFSGSLFVSYKDIRPGIESKRSRLGLASSHSRERALDGAPGDNSPFAAILLRQLRQTTADLTVVELAGSVIREVEGRTNSRQTPVFKHLDVKGDDEGQFVFHRRQTEPAWQQDWQAIAALPDMTEAQVIQTVLRIDSYLDQYSAVDNMAEAIALGEFLEHKRDFLHAQTSLFRLKKFALRPTPFQAEARERIEALRKGYVLPVEATMDFADHTPEPARLKKEVSKPVKSPPFNTFTDPRDGQVYRTVELNGLVWLAQNLNFDVGEGCWFYNNDPKNGEEYGRLYTWEAARRACPPGWRLPTDEEWKSLANYYGGYWDAETGKDVGDPKKACSALIKSGNTGFSVLLGGYRYSDGSFITLGYYGYYWGATEYSAGSAWSYGLIGSTEKLGRFLNDKLLGFSCRCVQD